MFMKNPGATKPQTKEPKPWPKHLLPGGKCLSSDGVIEQTNFPRLNDEPILKGKRRAAKVAMEQGVAPLEITVMNDKE